MQFISKLFLRYVKKKQIKSFFDFQERYSLTIFIAQ